jgi:hypothetical protein
LQAGCAGPTTRSKHPTHGDADTRPVSWKSAQEEASKWLGTLQLGRDLFGQVVDLSQKGDTLPFEGEFRAMVLEAVRRKLVKRKAKEIILPL